MIFLNELDCPLGWKTSILLNIPQHFSFLLLFPSLVPRNSKHLLPATVILERKIALEAWKEMFMTCSQSFLPSKNRLGPNHVMFLTDSQTMPVIMMQESHFKTTPSSSLERKQSGLIAFLSQGKTNACFFLKPS